MAYTGWLVVFAKDHRYQPGLKLGGVLPPVGNNSSRGLVEKDILSSQYRKLASSVGISEQARKCKSLRI